MGFGDFFFGHEQQTEKLPTLTPEQQNILSQLLGGVGGLSSEAFGGLRQMLSGGEAPWEQALKTQFEQETVPGIAERFSGIGEGSQQSSAFGQTLGKAGAGLAEKLAAMRAEERQQGLGLYNQLLGGALGTPSFGYRETPSQTGFAQQLSQILGTIAGGYLGGPAGAAAGGAMGSKVGGLFNKRKNTLTDTIGSGIAAGPYSSGTTYNPYTGVQL